MSNWARIERAMNETMTYDRVSVIENEKIYKVVGSRGIEYIVTISEKSRCSCPDFSLRGGRCKHQILIMIKDLNYAITDPIFGEKAKSNQRYDSNIQKECSICLDCIQFDDFIWNCKTCSNILHIECIRKWTSMCDRHNMRNSCPLCRSSVAC